MSTPLSPSPLPEESFITFGVSYSEKLGCPLKCEKNESLESIIEKICIKLNLSIPANYCLALEKENESVQYITEENRAWYFQGQLVYKLKILPSLRAEQHIHVLQDNVTTPQKARQTIEDCSKLLLYDYTYTFEFVRNKGHEHLVDIIVQADLSNGSNMDVTEAYEKVLLCLLQLGSYAASSHNVHDGSLFTWNIPALPDFRLKLCKFIQHKNVNLSRGMIIGALNILCHFMSTNEDDTVLILENLQSQCIYDRIQESHASSNPRENLDYQSAFVRFLFTIFESLESLEKKTNMKNVLENSIVRYLQPNVLKQHIDAIKTPKIVPEDHPIRIWLTKLQRYILWDLQIDLFTPLVDDERHLISLGALAGVSTYSRTSSLDAESNTLAVYRNLGFTNLQDPFLDFRRCPPGQLAYSCLRIFGIQANQRDLHQHLDSDHAFPFVRAARYLVWLLCSYFHVLEGVPIPMPCYVANDGNYQPLVYDSLSKTTFENFFNEAMSIFIDTWSEMSGTVRDFQQVFQVFKTRLLHALNKQPPFTKLDEFRSCMVDFRVTDVVRTIRDRFKMEREKENTHPAVVTLIERLNERYGSLLRQTRLQLLQEGKTLVDVTGETIQLCLNSNTKQMIVKRSNHSEEIFSKEQCGNHTVSNQDGRHLISIQRLDKSRLVLLCSTFEDCACLSDALLVYADKPPTSKFFKDQLASMVDIEKRVRLLDMNVHSLPKETPSVPPLPSNYAYVRE